METESGIEAVGLELLMATSALAGNGLYSVTNPAVTVPPVIVAGMMSSAKAAGLWTQNAVEQDAPLYVAVIVAVSSTETGAVVICADALLWLTGTKICAG